MKNIIKIVLTVCLICFSFSCTPEQIKKFGTATAGILPKVLATATHAFGGPYASLIGEFFGSASGNDVYKVELARLQTEAGYSESQSSEGGYNEGGYNEGGYSEGGYNEGGYSEGGYNEGGYSEGGYNEGGYNEGGYSENSSQPEEYNQGKPQEGYQENQQLEKNYNPYSQQDSASQGESLQVSIDLIKEEFKDGRFVAVSVTDGQTLTQSDNYKILIQSQTPCYIYIAQLDATGKMDPIFPSRVTQWKNPIQANMLYDIPTQKNWFYLDANVGVETIYFIASRTQRLDIERIFRELEMKNQTLVQQNQVSMQYAYSITRGIGGVRPGEIQSVSFKNGSQGQFASTIFESVQADFVITRWFHHR